MSQIRTVKHFVLAGVIILLWAISSPFIFAQSLPCGNIIGPESIYNFGGDYETIISTSIEDCDDPFGVTIDPPSVYSLEIDGVAVDEGDVYVQNEPISNLDINGRRPDTMIEPFLFKHEGTDYVFVDESVPEPTPAEYQAFAENYFPTTAEAQQYLEIYFEEQETGDTAQYFFDDEGEYLIDENTGEPIVDRYNTFWSAVNDYLNGRVIDYEAGTYTILIKESPIFQTQYSPWEYIRDFFIKTAHAQYIVPPSFYTITFTIADPVLEPEGASSVLFLPGIQASRLYTNGVLGTENQVWEPNTNADVELLAMTEAGESVNDIYTKDVIDEVNILPVLQGNIYKGFLEMLEGLVDDEVIEDFEAFAYDWRFSVDDVVEHGTQYEGEIRSVISALEDLAEDSFSGKVTIVGHSNGGLVAKALISELERLGKADLVESVVFIGTPHLGTPKAIGTVLHGYDQQKVGGLVVDDSTAREVIQNMPGAYGLLPSERYLQLAGEPVITFETGTSTAALTTTFGDSITSFAEYQNFLNGTEGRANIFTDISNPYTTNAAILEDALELHDDLDNWAAPEGIKVFNLVGVGLQTVRALEYRTVTERINCQLTFFGAQECDTVHILRPYAHFTQYGDETVASLSAQTVNGDTYYFDFEEFRSENGLFSRRDHADMTEVSSIQDFVSEVIAAGSVSQSFPYISNSVGTFSGEYEVTSIDSPVRIVKEDSSGNKTGVIHNNGVAEVVKEIPGSDYFELAGTKYVIVPNGVGVTTTLYGEALGSYTLTTAKLRNGDEQTIETKLVNATTTPTMVATYELTEEGYTNILTDFDGDGTIDLEMTLNGEVVEEEAITFEALREHILTANLVKGRVTPLLVLVRLAEEAEKLRVHPKIADRISDELLKQLRDTIKRYEKKKWVTETWSNESIKLINQLINL